MPETEQFSSLTEFGKALRVTHPEMFPARPRTARAHWNPTLLRIYGLRPWEMGRLTIGELRVLAADLEALSRGH